MDSRSKSICWQRLWMWHRCADDHRQSVDIWLIWNALWSYSAISKWPISAAVLPYWRDGNQYCQRYNQSILCCTLCLIWKLHAVFDKTSIYGRLGLHFGLSHLLFWPSLSTFWCKCKKVRLVTELLSSLPSSSPHSHTPSLPQNSADSNFKSHIFNRRKKQKWHLSIFCAAVLYICGRDRKSIGGARLMGEVTTY